MPTYDELVIVAREARPAPAAASGCAASCARSAQGHGRPAPRPARPACDPLLAANRDLDPRLQLESVKATLPAFFPPAGKPFGWMDRAAWARYGRWMFENELLERPPAIARALTDEFLPGEGPVADEATP